MPLTAPGCMYGTGVGESTPQEAVTDLAWVAAARWEEGVMALKADMKSRRPTWMLEGSITRRWLVS